MVRLPVVELEEVGGPQGVGAVPAPVGGPGVGQPRDGAVLKPLASVCNEGRGLLPPQHDQFDLSAAKRLFA